MAAKNVLFKFDPFIKTVVENPDKFVTQSKELENSALKITKLLFDFSKKYETKQVKMRSTIKKLKIDGFDEDQIWEELQLLNRPLTAWIETKIETFLTNSDIIDFQLDSLVRDTQEDYKVDDNSVERGKTDKETIVNEENAATKNLNNKSRRDDNSNSESSTTKVKKKKRKKSSLVDDEFFRLEDMEEFVRQAEKEENGFVSDRENNYDEDEEQEALDLLYGEHSQLPPEEFMDRTSDYVGEDQKTSRNNLQNLSEILSSKEKQRDHDFDASKAKYSDFFDPPDIDEDGNDNIVDNESDIDIDDEEGETDNEKSENKILQNTVEMKENGRNEPKNNKDEDDEFAFLSRHEKEQKIMQNQIQQLQEQNLLEEVEDEISKHEREEMKLRQKIKQLEEENLVEKPWQLRGEIQASKRPTNSLLEEALEFEHATKLPPIITEETTKVLEEIIKERIKESAFDDVILKQNPPKKGDFRPTAVELDVKKSSKSLAEIYEEEYLKSVANYKPETELTKKHKEAATLFKRICYKLDALAHTQYTPRKTKDEIEVKTVQPNVPAITMEEVTPVTVSDAQRLAPEEIYDPKNVRLQSPEELSSEEKKKIRRKKKRIIKLQKQQKEAEKKRKEKLKDVQERSVALALKQIKETGTKNTITVTPKDTTNYSQSSEVFAKLQREANTGIHKTKKSQSPPETKNLLTSNILKL
jgi:U3 small nucleolar RNA-associated protein MPP10